MRTTDERQKMRRAWAMLVASVAGLIVAIVSGLEMVPRVRAVDVILLLAFGMGSGAALVGAIVEFREARKSARRSRP